MEKVAPNLIRSTRVFMSVGCFERQSDGVKEVIKDGLYASLFKEYPELEPNQIRSLSLVIKSPYVGFEYLEDDFDTIYLEGLADIN